MAVTAKYVLSYDPDTSRVWTFTRYGLNDINDNYDIIDIVKGCKIKLLGSTLTFIIRFRDSKVTEFVATEDNVPDPKSPEHKKYISIVSRIFFDTILYGEESENISLLKSLIGKIYYQLPPIIL